MAGYGSKKNIHQETVNENYPLVRTVAIYFCHGQASEGFSPEDAEKHLTAQYQAWYRTGEERSTFVICNISLESAEDMCSIFKTDCFDWIDRREETAQCVHLKRVRKLFFRSNVTFAPSGEFSCNLDLTEQFKAVTKRIQDKIAAGTLTPEQVENCLKKTTTEYTSYLGCITRLSMRHNLYGDTDRKHIHRTIMTTRSTKHIYSLLKEVDKGKPAFDLAAYKSKLGHIYAAMDISCGGGAEEVASAIRKEFADLAYDTSVGRYESGTYMFAQLYVSDRMTVGRLSSLTSRLKRDNRIIGMGLTCCPEYYENEIRAVLFLCNDDYDEYLFQEWLYAGEAFDYLRQICGINDSCRETVDRLLDLYIDSYASRLEEKYFQHSAEELSFLKNTLGLNALESTFLSCLVVTYLHVCVFQDKTVGIGSAICHLLIPSELDEKCILALDSLERKGYISHTDDQRWSFSFNTSALFAIARGLRPDEYSPTAGDDDNLCKLVNHLDWL